MSKQYRMAEVRFGFSLFKLKKSVKHFNHGMTYLYCFQQNINNSLKSFFSILSQVHNLHSPQSQSQDKDQLCNTGIKILADTLFKILNSSQHCRYTMVMKCGMLFVLYGISHSNQGECVTPGYTRRQRSAEYFCNLETTILETEQEDGQSLSVYNTEWVYSLKVMQILWEQYFHL